MRYLLALAITIVAFSFPALAAGPCQTIRDACLASGFVKGDAKQGFGLWHDCIDPIMQGQTSVPGATKQLPPPPPNGWPVAACKAKHPKFGEGKVGS